MFLPEKTDTAFSEKIIYLVGCSRTQPGTSYTQIGGGTQKTEGVVYGL